MKKALALAALLALAACAPPLDQQARNICLDNGLVIGTPAFSQCFENVFNSMAISVGMMAGGRR